MSILVITGTSTGVGKTVVTAAIAALARYAGQQVAVVKATQTGLAPDEPGDLADIAALSGCTDLHEPYRFADPLAPEAAARHAGLPYPDRDRIVTVARELAADRDLVLVEGAGGLLVRFDDQGTTLADIAADLDAPLLVVADPALGTLNHTALTLEAIDRRGLTCAGVVLGSWPQEPDLACRSNLIDLPRIVGSDLRGAIAAGAGELSAEAFRHVAEAGLDAGFGGRFNGSTQLIDRPGNDQRPGTSSTPETEDGR